MRSSLVVKASDCQCTRCNGPEFDPSLRRHSGIWGKADEAVLNTVRKKISLLSARSPSFLHRLSAQSCWSEIPTRPGLQQGITLPTELCCILTAWARYALLSYAIPFADPFWTALPYSELRCILWTSLLPTELICTLLSSLKPSLLRCWCILPSKFT